MSSPPYQPQTILLPVNLGRASGFDRAIFPISSHKKRDSLARSGYYLDATLDEMLKITNIGANPEQLRKFFKTTKERYDQLILKKAELEECPQTWNLLKRFANYRAVRLFVASSKSLYYQTKSRSDEVVRTLNRELLVSVPGEDVQPVEDDGPSLDMDVAGIAVRLDRPLDDAASQQLINAANTIVSYSGTFEGNETTSDASSVLSDEYYLASESLTSLSIGVEEETPDVPTPPNPSSPTITNNNHYYGCIYSVNSSIIGGTTQFDGQGNSGSVNHNVKTTSDMPNPLV